MKTYLLKMKVNGIKSIDKEVELNFYKNIIDKDFNPKDYHVKAIYGANGAGKTALIYAVEIYKNLLFDDTYLTLSSLNGSLKSLINQNTNTFTISMTFIVIDKYNINRKYEHFIQLSNKEDKYYISYEKLEEIKGNRINDLNKRVLIYKTENGALTLGSTISGPNDLEQKSMNLLTNQTLARFIINNYKTVEVEDRNLVDAVCSVAGLFFSIKVVLQDSDRNYINTNLLQNQLKSYYDFESHVGNDLFQSFIALGRIPKSTIEVVAKKDLKTYKTLIQNLKGFLKIFKPDLEDIEIKTEEKGDSYECQNIMVYQDGRRIDKKYESTGIKKIIEYYQTLCDLEQGNIVFIDEFDANLHDVLLVKLIEYISEYSNGQFIFTTHNLAPMELLQKKKNSLDFLSTDSHITSWKKNGNSTAASLYRNGYIEHSPFNIEAFSFLGTFGSANDEGEE